MKRELALLLCVFAGISSAPASADENAPHRAAVERKSELVMPFSMELTKHVFTPAANGGTQAVLVTDGDRKQVELVRSHLQAECVKFARGDYSDPLAIHGAAMPGLALRRCSWRR